MQCGIFECMPDSPDRDFFIHAVKNVPRIGCMERDGEATTRPHASAPKSVQMQLDPDMDVNGIAKI